MSFRTEAGHVFEKNLSNIAWKTTSGKLVYVWPPYGEITFWRVEVLSTGTIETVEGEDAEKRAFSIAERFSRQN